MVAFLLVCSSNYRNNNITDQFFELFSSSHEQVLSDKFVLGIARTIPHAKYHDVGVELGFQYNHVDNTLAGIQAPDRYKQATTKILMEWKDMHGGGPDQKKQLVDILASLGIKTSEGERTPSASIFPLGMMDMIMIKCQ